MARKRRREQETNDEIEQARRRVHQVNTDFADSIDDAGTGGDTASDATTTTSRTAASMTRRSGLGH